MSYDKTQRKGEGLTESHANDASVAQEIARTDPFQAFQTISALFGNAPKISVGTVHMGNVMCIRSVVGPLTIPEDASVELKGHGLEYTRSDGNRYKIKDIRRVTTINGIPKDAYVQTLHALSQSSAQGEEPAKPLHKPMNRIQDAKAEPLDDDDDDDDGKNADKACCICMNNRKTVMFLDCGHICACPDCAKKLSNDDPRCPICTQKIVSARIAYY